jgi:hypothetical protein
LCLVVFYSSPGAFWTIFLGNTQQHGAAFY